MLKILIGSLTNRGFRAKTVESLMNLHIPYEKVFYVATQGYHIAENRNWLAFKAINEECDYLFMVDDDMVFPPCTLTRMVGHQKDIVGVVAKSRTGENVIQIDGKVPKDEEIPKELFECDALGTGVILIKTDILKTIPYPFFSFKSDINGVTVQGEDWSFCKKVKDKGYKIFCDPTIQVGHIGEQIF